MSGKSKKLGKRWVEVTCAIHGKPDSHNHWKPPQVKVGPPPHKRSRQGGCPICAKTK